MDKMKFETQNLAAVNLAKLAELFPGVVAEGKVNVDLLRTLVGEEIFGDEAYEFTWVGKRAAIAEAGRPLRKTLRPCPEESRDWETTENLYIEGDNLDVLKLLQESYLGKVKMIYIDPPYNTGNDFVYRDNFAASREEYEEEAGVYNEEGDRLFKNTESNGRFHSDWCSMMYPRLVLGRNLLRDDGVIFISIDDNEVAQLRKVCDEVFGSGNFIATFVWASKGSGAYDSEQYKTEHEYILAYGKSVDKFFANKQQYDTSSDKAYRLKDERYEIAGKYKRQALAMGTLTYSQSLDYPVVTPDGSAIFPGGSYGPPFIWRYSKQKLENALGNGFVEFVKTRNGWSLFSKQYERMDSDGSIIVREKPFSTMSINAINRNGSELVKKLLGRRVFEYPKPLDIPLMLSRSASNTEDIILDFFSGSATTAHAVMQLNAEDGGRRKFIMVQLPEVCAEGTEAAKAGYANICEIGKERIRRAGKKIKEENKNKEGIENLDIGFRVLKLADTNMKDVYYAAGEYTQDLVPTMESNIKPDRTDMDLLFGCLLDWGLPLSMPHTREVIDGATVHTYNNGDLIACFSEKVSESVVREIAGRQPLRAVFRDSSFASSPEKINVTEIFKLLAPGTAVRVI
jgi:adenine-specific DNA-methyltransferase